jgi:two-component system OmpR family response regulator
MRPTVLIADDHDGFRTAAGVLLDAEGFTVVGGAAGGPTALAEVARLRPDVVLLDVQLPGFDGFAVGNLLAAGPDPPRVVLISSRPDYGRRLDGVVARGLLSKADLTGATLTALVG